MVKFTTEERRRITSAMLDNQQLAENVAKFKNNVNSAFGEKVEEDASNRDIFRVINSKLTGYSYEYRYMNGIYHPALDEKEYTYIKANEEMTEFSFENYYDSPKLQSAGKLEDNNEFHLNTREDTPEYYPSRPLKYAEWYDDLSEYNSYFAPTENELWTLINDLITYYSSGGVSGNLETNIYGEFEYFTPEKFPYMTIGEGTPLFTENGFNRDNDIILIKTDNDNYTIGKVIESKESPSRICFAPFVLKGEIADNNIITSTFTINDNFITIIILDLINELKNIYENMKRYLEKNPDTYNSGSDDETTLTNIQTTLDFIFAWEESSTKENHGEISTLITDISNTRSNIFIERTNYITTTLEAENNPNDNLYLRRFDILDSRLSKRMGTLREMMKVEANIEEMDRIMSDKDLEYGLLSKYFKVHKCHKDGDWKRRVIIVDSNSEIQVGDTVYILTDSTEIPEVKCIVDEIVDARYYDEQTVSVNELTQEIERDYFPIKKVFIRDVEIEPYTSGIIKSRYYFSPKYLQVDKFRVVKQVSE
ncbi:MAG: hypothetical protein ACOC1O_00875 [bacterium]